MALSWVLAAAVAVAGGAQARPARVDAGAARSTGQPAATERATGDSSAGVRAAAIPQDEPQTLPSSGGAELSPTSRPARPNVVIISIDMLRPDHLGCYGYSRATSPHIDELAAEGVLFEQTVSSSSWTLPAHAALFTGLSDTVHGCTDTKTRLDESRTTLAERLKGVGYRTVGFFSGPYLHPAFGLGQGFDEYIDCTSYKQMTEKAAAAEADGGRAGGVEGVKIMAAAHEDVTSPRILEKVTNWLGAHAGRAAAGVGGRAGGGATAKSSAPRADVAHGADAPVENGAAGPRHASQPFFMFIHMWDPHFDFIPPPPYDKKFDPEYIGAATGKRFFFDNAVNAQMPKRDLEHIVALYDGEIAWTDEHVGKILAELDRLKLRDETIVILLSDHGTEFFEHGQKAHRKTLFDEAIRIPLIVRYPGRLPAGRRVSRQARIIDVVPTVLDWLGRKKPRDVMGQSLAPFVTDESAAGEVIAISELFSVGRMLRAYRRVDGKMIVNEKDGGTIAFDLQTDPGEQTPVKDRGEGFLTSLIPQSRQARTLLLQWQKAMPEPAGMEILPDEVRRQLESFGYVARGAEPGGGGPAPTSGPARGATTRPAATRP